jgi:hypothetical protein
MTAVQDIFFGLLALFGGSGMYYYAEGLTRFSEQLDAIGSTTPIDEVEPAGWNVMLTRLVGALITFAGLALVVGGLT